MTVDLDEAVRPMGGLYHASSKGETTWFGFAREFVQIAREAMPEKTLARLVAIPSSAYPTAAVRPKNSRLNCGKLARGLEFEMPEWESATREVMEEVLADMSSALRQRHLWRCARHGIVWCRSRGAGSSAS